jgi:hypothetical protein
MKLIKVEKDGHRHYFSNKSKAAEFLQMDSYNIPYYIKRGKEYYGWMITECYDNVMTNDVDKESFINSKN